MVASEKFLSLVGQTSQARPGGQHLQAGDTTLCRTAGSAGLEYTGLQPRYYVDREIGHDRVIQLYSYMYPIFPTAL